MCVFAFSVVHALCDLLASGIFNDRKSIETEGLFKVEDEKTKKEVLFVFPRTFLMLFFFLSL
jgi:hypothetical protein